MPKLKDSIPIGGDFNRYFEEFLKKTDQLEVANKIDAAKVCKRSAQYITDIINNDINSIFSYIRDQKVKKPNMRGYNMLVELMKSGNYASLDEIRSFLPEDFEDKTYADMPSFINVSRKDINQAINNVLPEDKAKYIISRAKRMENNEDIEYRTGRKYASDVLFTRESLARNGFKINTPPSFMKGLYEDLDIDPEKYSPIELEEEINDIFSYEIESYQKSDLEKKYNKMWDLGDLRYYLFINQALANYYTSKLLDEGKLNMERVGIYDDKGPKGTSGYCFRLNNYKDLKPMLLNTSDSKTYSPSYTYKGIATGDVKAQRNDGGMKRKRRSRRKSPKKRRSRRKSTKKRRSRRKTPKKRKSRRKSTKKRR